MAEKVIVHQNHKLETFFMISDPEVPDETLLKTIDHIHELTSYGLLLASLGSCTAIVMNTFAQNHRLSLKEVEITLEYDRTFKQDCDNCDKITDFSETIQENIVMHGDLSSQEQQRLLAAAHQCPIYKILGKGIQINTQVTGIGADREQEIRRK
jgi:uncharacterized OsmC-like protein